MEAASPGRLLEALALGPGAASETHPAWADLDGAELPPPEVFFAGSPGLLHELRGRSCADRVDLGEYDYDDLSDPDDSPCATVPPQPPMGADGAADGAGPSRRGRRPRRHRPRRKKKKLTTAVQGPDPLQPPARGRPRSVILRVDRPASPPRPSPRPPAAHPPRARGPQDEDGFFSVQSRRFGQSWSPHRSPPRSPHKVPAELQGRCFRCLRRDHTMARCTFPARCYNCEDEWHRAAACPRPSKAGAPGRKRRRSASASPPVRRRVFKRLPRGGRSRASADTAASACSASSGSATSR